MRLNQVLSVSRNQRYELPLLTLLATLAVLCWLLCTAAQIEKHFSLFRSAVLCAFGSAGVVLVLLLLRHVYKTGRDAGRWSLVGIFGLLALLFAVLYPKSLQHQPGRGSDREDALRVELYAVTHHQYPYAARTYLDHPPTPLPGAMWLAAPFYFAARIALQNLLWAALFLYFMAKYFRKRATAVAFAFLFLLTALGNLNDFVVGGDYVTNLMYVSVAIFLFIRSVDRPPDRPDTGWQICLAVILFGIALSSRIAYVVTIPPVFALTLQHTRPRRALLLMAAVLSTAIVVTLPVFAPHPFSRLLVQLNQNADKLRLLPRLISGSTLPIAAMLVASCAFFIRMALPRVFLLAGIASSIMILPPMALFVSAEGGLTQPLTVDLEYLALSALFIALWIFARWEQIGIDPNSADHSFHH